MTRQAHVQNHRSLRALVLVFAAIGFAALLAAWASTLATAAFKALGFASLGLAGVVLIGHAWWYRLPIKIKGGLSPERPVFYHLGSALFFGMSLLLAITGATQLKDWLLT